MWLTIWLVTLCLAVSLGQISKPIGTDAQMDVSKNKFLKREADVNDAFSTRSDELVLDGQCDANLVLRWMTEVGSSIYATPILHDLYSDGQMDIIVPSFVHLLEVLDGSDGSKAKSDSWPADHKSVIHTSPLLYDYDKDNIKDILVATYDGEILVFQDTGEMMEHSMIVPRLKVHKNWYEGLMTDFIDHSKPDVGTGNASNANLDLKASGGGRKLMESTGDFAGKDHSEYSKSRAFKEGAKRGLKQVGNVDPYSVHSMAGGEDMSWNDFPLHSDGLGGVDDWHDSRNAAHGDYEIPITWGGGEDAWGEERYFASPHLHKPDWVEIDSHILCTPAIGDIDNDGHDEIVVAVSYFFDRDYYERPDRKAELGKDIDIGKYIAGGIVVFDLSARRVKWLKHLDLSTDHTQFRAYIYSSPTLVDLDADEKLEIIVGTSMGFIYVMDHQGEQLEGWPLQMGDIQAQVGVAQLLKNNEVQIVAVDARGNVAVFDRFAKEIWERHLGTSLTQMPTFADLNGDGYLEIILGGSDGGVYVLSSISGLDISPFPFYTQGKILAPVLATKIRQENSMQLIFPSDDGHLYIVDSVSGCADVVDIGETTYAMVLSEDINHDGKLDLVLSTMNGNVYAFETQMKVSPQLSWPAQVPSLGGFSAKSNWFSVEATSSTREPRDVKGRSLDVKFTIKDDGFQTLPQSNYTAFVWLQGIHRDEMNAGEFPVIGTKEQFLQPGMYSLQIPCPKSRSTATILIEVKNQWGISVTDSFSLSFHMHFYRLLKWLLAGPFVIACLVILACESEDIGLGLPSFQ